MVAALIFVAGLFGGGALGLFLALRVSPFSALLESDQPFGLIAFLIVISGLCGLPGLLMFRRCWPRD